MPITFSFDHEQGLIFTRVTDELTIAITEDYFARLQQDNECPENAIEVVDFSGVTDFTIHNNEMNRIAKTYQNTKITRDIRATIFNCTSDHSYGIARMLQAYHELTNEKHVVIITRSQEDLTQCIKELLFNQSDAGDSQ